MISGYDSYWDTQYENMKMNSFVFKVGVEISDHPLTMDLSSLPLTVAMQVGDIVMQGRNSVSTLTP